MSNLKWRQQRTTASGIPLDLNLQNNNFAVSSSSAARRGLFAGPERRRRWRRGGILPLLALSLVGYTAFRRTQLQELSLEAFDEISSDTSNQINAYKPSLMEDFVLSRLDELGYNQDNASICNLWRNATDAYADISAETQMYITHLDKYAAASEEFKRPNNRSLLEEITATSRDSRGNLTWDDASEQVCKTLRMIHAFPNATSLLSHSSRFGFIEPLLPPMRHPQFCIHPKRFRFRMSLAYLVHDFYTMCRSLKMNSRVVLIDMGASLDFHGEVSNSPPVYLVSKLRQFGFFLDHIYAYETTPKDPKQVYAALPNDWITAYHWINIPVETVQGGTYRNPLEMVLHEMDEDDLVLVKLDIDNTALELQLVNQILAQEKLHTKIDHFYFEHHVHTAEMKKAWNKTANGTVKDSLTIFQNLRKLGVASHYWP